MKIQSIGSNQTEVTLSDGTVILVSYSTPVACFIPGQGYYRTSERFSVTTSKHITRWLDGVKATEEPQTFFNSLI